MDKYVDIVESGICNYDGACQFGNHDKGYAFCYGEKFGTAECPLKDSKVLVSLRADVFTTRYIVNIKMRRMTNGK